MSFRKGQRVVCIEASEVGIPIRVGEVYTIRRYYKPPHYLHEKTGDAPIEDRVGIPGVSLEECPNAYFMATRFKAK